MSTLGIPGRYQDDSSATLSTQQTLATSLSPLQGCKISAERMAFQWNGQGKSTTTAALKNIPEYDFLQCFQEQYSQWQKCVVTQEQYFEGSVV
jgi:hypothetical protein